MSHACLFCAAHSIAASPTSPLGAIHVAVWVRKHEQSFQGSGWGPAWQRGWDEGWEEAPLHADAPVLRCEEALGYGGVLGCGGCCGVEGLCGVEGRWGVEGCWGVEGR